MTTDQKIRELRRMFAQSERRGASWKHHWRNKSSMRYELSQRRETRRFRKLMYSENAFRRLVDHHSDNMAIVDFLLRLQILKIFITLPFNSKDAKLARQKYLKAKTDVQTAARVLQNYMVNSSHPRDIEALNRAAEIIEHTPAHAVEDHSGPAFAFFNLSLMGQKGDRRAFLIRSLDNAIPDDVPLRDSMIRDFLAALGFNATSSLVRSTILNGHT